MMPEVTGGVLVESRSAELDMRADPMVFATSEVTREVVPLGHALAILIPPRLRCCNWWLYIIQCIP